VTKLWHIKCDHPACVSTDGGHFEHVNYDVNWWSRVKVEDIDVDIQHKPNCLALHIQLAGSQLSEFQRMTNVTVGMAKYICNCQTSSKMRWTRLVYTAARRRVDRGFRPVRMKNDFEG